MLFPVLLRTTRKDVTQRPSRISDARSVSPFSHTHSAKTQRTEGLNYETPFLSCGFSQGAFPLSQFRPGFTLTQGRLGLRPRQRLETYLGILPATLCFQLHYAQHNDPAGKGHRLEGSLHHVYQAKLISSLAAALCFFTPEISRIT